jgi:DNA-binding MarR family transcriptional regulator
MHERTDMTSTPRFHMIERFIELSHQISTQMRSSMAMEWPEHELSMPQFKALVQLSSGRQRMGDLARDLGISLSSATNLVGRLESKGLAQRDHDSEDRRVVMCELTGDGQETVSRFWSLGQQQVAEMTRSLTDEQFEQVLTAFELLSESGKKANLSGDDPLTRSN